MNHPIDAKLGLLHPDLRRVTLGVLNATPLAATLLVLSHDLRSPHFALDIFLTHDGTNMAMTSPQAALETLPILFISGGSVLDPNGTIAPDALAITPCACSRNNDVRWNPLCIAVEWIDALDPLGNSIAPLMDLTLEAMQQALLANLNQYCDGGLALLTGLAGHEGGEEKQ